MWQWFLHMMVKHQESTRIKLSKCQRLLMLQRKDGRMGKTATFAVEAVCRWHPREKFCIQNIYRIPQLKNKTSNLTQKGHTVEIFIFQTGKQVKQHQSLKKCKLQKIPHLLGYLKGSLWPPWPSEQRISGGRQHS